MKYDIFLSHASKTSKLALQFVEQFEADGLKCWIAPRNLEPGSSWAEGIINGIESSTFFLLLLCPHSNDSTQVLREVERAADKNISIIPVFTTELTLSKNLEFFISTHQWFTMSKLSRKKDIKELSRTIKDRIGGEVSPSPSSPPKKYLILLSVFMVLFFIGVGWTYWWKPSLPPLWNQIETMVEIADYSIPITTNKDKFSEGDLLKITCIPPRSGYLTIFSHTIGSDKVTMLFPNAGNPNNHVKKEETVLIPSPTDKYVIRADADTGKTILVAFVDQTPSVLHSLQLANNQTFVESSVDLVGSVRGFSAEVIDSAPTTIGAGILSLKNIDE